MEETILHEYWAVLWHAQFTRYRLQCCKKWFSVWTRPYCSLQSEAIAKLDNQLLFCTKPKRPQSFHSQPNSKLRQANSDWQCAEIQRLQSKIRLAEEQNSILSVQLLISTDPSQWSSFFTPTQRYIKNCRPSEGCTDLTNGHFSSTTATVLVPDQWQSIHSLWFQPLCDSYLPQQQWPQK